MTANPVRPARYRPGKPTAPEEDSDEDPRDDSEASSEASSDSEASPPPPPKPVYKKTDVSREIKNVDLSKRFDAGRKAEEARLAEEAARRKEEEAKDDGYTTEESSGSEEEGSEDEEGMGEDYEGSSEAPKKVLLRPTFVPKSKRSAIATVGADEEAARRKGEEERRRQEASELLEEHLKRDAEARAAGRKGWDDDDDAGEGIDDTDGLDPAAERAAWKLRELIRIKRERVALAEIEKERAEIERRREMDPALREKEDLEFVQEQRKEKMENRGKMGFMQKFYHKGAFYQENEILKRNYATASVQDSVKNREALPKYLQVRGDEVGKRGRTKWTHLAAEDTALQDGGSMWNDKRRDNMNANRFPIAPRGDERFMPDRMRESKDRGAAREDRFGGRGGGGREDGGQGRGGRVSGERTSRWDDHPRHRTDRGPRGDEDRRQPDGGERKSRWDDDGGGRPPDGPRRDRYRDMRAGGDSYIPGRGDDRERKRPHSPRSRDHDGEKRRRRDASPAR